MLVAASRARHSRVNSSMTARTFSFVPFRQESWTKSRLQTLLGKVGESGMGDPVRLLLNLVLGAMSSCFQARQTLLWLRSLNLSFRPSPVPSLAAS